VEKIISVLEKLISFDTTSHKSNFEAISYIENLFKNKKKYKIYKVFNSNRNKLSILIKPNMDVKNGILFAGHIDTVSVEGQNWSNDPFKLLKKNNKLFGRGTTDMKGFLAVVISSMLNKNNREFPFCLSVTYDEETGCNGIYDLSNFIKRKKISLPNKCIVGEPTKLKIVTANKGVEVFDTFVESKKELGHSSNYNQRVNTITLISELVFNFQAIQNTIPKKNLLKCRPNNTAIHIGMINGGTSHNIIPRKSFFRTEVRYINDDIQYVKKKMNKIQNEIMKKYSYYSNYLSIKNNILAHVPSLKQKKQTKILDFMKKIHNKEISHVPYGTEAGIIQNLGLSTIIFGPGSIDQAHKPNEYISILELKKFKIILEKMI